MVLQKSDKINTVCDKTNASVALRFLCIITSYDF